ncbi:hypothetical protein DL96DRAFT_1233545 [Flagelloscypha sp. PMI_526]|nr:hypothetical protein DL96DRAFT_1233545 [Flagelloscypha sp. PMI_526]
MSEGKDERSRNARAQARHRAKRKAYVEQLEGSLKRLQQAVGVTVQDLDKDPNFKPPAHRIRELEAENAILRDEIKTLRESLMKYEAQETRRRASFHGAQMPQSSLPDPTPGIHPSPHLLAPMSAGLHEYRAPRPSLALPPLPQRSYFDALHPELQPSPYPTLQPTFRRYSLDLSSPAPGPDNSSASSPLSQYPHHVQEQAPPASHSGNYNMLGFDGGGGPAHHQPGSWHHPHPQPGQSHGVYPDDRHSQTPTL